jgi:hypothetical protein
MTQPPDEPHPLGAQDEVLQVMYWMRGEGISTEVVAADLARFIGRSELDIEGILERLSTLGLVRPLPGGGAVRFALTADGLREGGRRFADEFAALTKPGHGECGDPQCDCRQTGNPADCRHHT